jgi:type II restriction/modification system DNA methylase subunit YeeA
MAFRSYYSDIKKWEDKVTSFTLPTGQTYSLYQNWYLMERDLFAKIQPDVIITTGNSEKPEYEKYFDEIETACTEAYIKDVIRRYSFEN